MPKNTKFLLFLSLFFISFLTFWNIEYQKRIHPLATLPTQASHPPLTYLPGALDLRAREIAVLGWDTEPVTQDQIVSLVNKEREKVGSPDLTINVKLTQAAQMRADTILKYQNFSHQDPYGHIQLDTVLPKVGYLFSYASENIGLDQNTAVGIVHGFMSSPPHRQNLLDKNLRETGVAVDKGWFKGNYVEIIVQIFGSPASLTAYRGYSDTDITTVERLLQGIDGEIAKTDSYLKSQPQSSYYQGWLTVLDQQKSRLSQVHQQMLTGLPYTQKDYNLIAAYNSGWNAAPTNP